MHGHQRDATSSQSVFSPRRDGLNMDEDSGASSGVVAEIRQVAATIKRCSISKMADETKQRVVAEFLAAEGVSPTDVHRRMVAVYDKFCVSVDLVRSWIDELTLPELSTMQHRTRDGEGRHTVSTVTGVPEKPDVGCRRAMSGRPTRSAATSSRSPEQTKAAASESGEETTEQAAEPVVKRGRGRRKKTETQTHTETHTVKPPIAEQEPTGSPKPKRPRGRPKGSKNKGPSKAALKKPKAPGEKKPRGRPRKWVSDPRWWCAFEFCPLVIH
uniref:Uncharacterized protein n=1 Tax=Eptatretus burgeri TaxID=7764 RepID=A0A8C4WYA9_EPTBU